MSADLTDTEALTFARSIIDASTPDSKQASAVLARALLRVQDKLVTAERMAPRLSELDTIRAVLTCSVFRETFPMTARALQDLLDRQPQF